MGRLEGKVAVVLGAAGRDNMGQVIARRFAAEGAKIVVGGRNEEPLAALARELDGAYCLCDITDKADIAKLCATAVDRYGRVDIAMNCAGWALMGKIMDVTEEQLDRITALQFKGVYFFLQVFGAAMAKSGGGSLIQTTSASVYALLFHHAAYIATKAAGDSLVRCFANELGSKGVKVNSIAPGITDTPMSEKELQMPGLKEAFLKEYPLGRIGSADDVANAALWLASDESFVTGQVIHANGGLTLRRNPLPWEINASMKAAAEKK